MFQDDAQEKHYLGTMNEKKYDEAVIPVVQTFIEKYPNERKFIIVHLMGSHVKYSMQYPEKEKFFSSGDTVIDNYNDTIRYSDKVIHQIVSIVMGLTHPGFVLYASDHGENLNDFGDGNWGHGTREFTRFEFEIPFIIYFNDAFLGSFSKQAALIRAKGDCSISQDNISHTFLGVAGILDDSCYRSNEDLSSTTFKTQPRYVIDVNMNVYRFDKLGLYDRPVVVKKKRTLSKFVDTVGKRLRGVFKKDDSQK
jgi:heptose-I-phosphate ethanolaminephosphotransferase